MDSPRSSSFNNLTKLRRVCLAKWKRDDRRSKRYRVKLAFYLGGRFATAEKYNAT